MGLLDRLRLFAAGVGLGIDDAGVFSRTQWNLPWIGWFIYRLLLVIYYVAFIGYFFINAFVNDPLWAAYFFIYLTDWTVLVVIFYMVVIFVNLCIDRNHGRFYHTTNVESLSAIVLSRRHKLQWILMNVYMNVSILVTIVYWSLLWTPGSALYFDLTCHLFPSILGLIDLILTPIPIKIQHGVYPLLFGLTYMVFTLIYYYAGGTDAGGNPGIYPGFLDWSNPGPTTVDIICSGLGIAASQFLLWGLYKGKMYLIRLRVSTLDSERMYGNETESIGSNQEDSRTELPKINCFDNQAFEVE